MSKSFKFVSRLSFLLCFGIAGFATSTLFAGQGVQRMLCTVPNSTFIENPSGDSVVTVNDTSGSISTLQTSINNARSANPNSIIVIHLLRGATYSVSNTGLVLGANECLIGSGAIIQAADLSVTVPLITISSGSVNVSVAGGTLDGNGANINGITAPAAARVNIDKVVVRNCGQDCILLKGNGDTTFDNEMTVTRCDASGSPNHAGISIQNCTQAAVIDNNCHNNSVGFWLNCAWADVANNTCENNTTGINANGGNDNYIANNTCNNNGTGIYIGGSANMIVSDAVDGNTVVGINSAGSGNIYCDNLFGSSNASNFTSGGSGDDVIAYDAPISAPGQNYFYPPLIDNQHTTTIVNGMGRFDLTDNSTGPIDNVQSEYNSAVNAHPGNVIVLHLNGNYTVGANPLTLGSDTCVLLGGKIQINSSTTASVAVTTSSGASYISFSGGLIDGGSSGVPATGREGIYFSGNSMFQIDAVTLQHFGTNSTRVGGSDVVRATGGGTPRIVTRCTVNGGSARGIWLENGGPRSIVSDNVVTDVQMDGVDCDASTSQSLVKFNTLTNNTRYGVFVEQSASYNLMLGNVCNFDHSCGVGCYNNSTTPRAATAFNSIICNSIMGNGGLRNGSTGDGTSVESSDNFYFDNNLINASIVSQNYGSQNYYSQNYQAGGSLSTSGAEVFFNSPDVAGNLQILDSNSGLGVIVQGASTSNGAAVITATPSSLGNGTGDDEWQLVPTGNGYYKIINENSGLAMVVSGASMTNGAPIVQFTYNGSGNDEWLIQPVGNGLYGFVNRLSGLNLDVTGASKTPGTQLDQWPSNGGANQRFSLLEDTPSTASPDFSMSTSPGSQSVVPGNGTSYTVTVTPTNNFSGVVTFSVSGLPSGASASFNPTSVTGSGNSTLSVSTSTSTPGGTYVLTVTGTSGNLSHSDTVNLLVSDFSVSATPSSESVQAGNNISYTVNLGNIDAFSGAILLTAGGLPSGAGASFNPPSLTAPGSSTMTVTTSGSTPAANSTLTITGTSGSIAHSTNVTLQVTDFSLGINPSSQNVTAGNNTTYTVSVSALNGFNGTVTFGSVGGLPSGASASFAPTSVTGAGSSTLTVTTSTSTPVGTNTLTIPATCAGQTHNVTATLIVTASGGGLPIGWTDTDIGAVGIAGRASYNNGTFAVSGAGSDIWTAADQFNYAYESVSGDQIVIARVVSETGTQSFAKAAVMTRETLATNSVEVSTLLTPTNGVAMEVRPTTGAASINVAGWVKGPLPPQWIKLVRSGNTFTASYSADGNSWTQIASTNVTMATSATAGLAVTAHTTNALNTATFDNVSITAGSSFVGVFQLQNVASGLMLNNQGSLTNGSAITQWTSVNSSNLDWTFITTSNGYYQINSAKSGLDAVVQSASTVPGAKIIQWSFGSSGDDQWKPVLNSDGSYTFYNLHSGLVLADPGGSTSNTTQMDQETANGGSNQEWKLISQ